MSRRVARLLAVGVAVALIGARLMSGGPAEVQAKLPTVEPHGAAGDRLILEPDEGMTAIYSLLASPRRSLDLTMYELVDPTAESVLASDAARGVRVRVLLDHRLEAARNAPAYRYLQARGVEVVWSSPRFFATHEKAFVIDDETAVVMSLNLTDRYYATSRDAAVIDHDPPDVAAIESVFVADLHGGGSETPAADDLVWSPNQSQADLVALIDSAAQRVAVESEELTSPSVIAALVAAARRGVEVSVAMTYDAAAVPGLNAVAAAGGTVSLWHGESPLYIHAKLMAVDAGTPHERAFVGSENFSDSSLFHDRELGIVLLSPPLVSRIAATIASDVSGGQQWH